ncbi:hypothetical protein [Arthrobacter echini]|nr:hypothetical protein [Arthrobacter echini]
MPFREYLRTVRSVAGHEGPVVSVPEQWLLEQGVQQWSGQRSLPL